MMVFLEYSTFLKMHLDQIPKKIDFFIDTIHLFYYNGS